MSRSSLWQSECYVTFKHVVAVPSLFEVQVPLVLANQQAVKSESVSEHWCLYSKVGTVFTDCYRGVTCCTCLWIFVEVQQKFVIFAGLHDSLCWWSVPCTVLAE